MEPKLVDQRGKAIETISASETLAIQTVNLGHVDPFAPDDVGPDALQRLQKLVAYKDAALKMSIARTYPSQWTIFASEDGSRKVVRPNGTAASAILSFFGMHFAAVDGSGRDATYEETSETKGGDRVVWAHSALWRGDKMLIPFSGCRALGGYVKSDRDCRKSALENLKSRAVQVIFGIGGLTTDDAAKLGVDVSRVPVSEFRDHAKSSDPSQAKIPFGKLKGTLVKDAPNSELEYHAKRCRADIETAARDPASTSDEEEKKNILAKKKYLRSSEALLKAIVAEFEHRKGLSEDEKLSPDDELKIEALCVSIREYAQAAGVPSEATEKRIQGLRTVQAAEEALAKAKALTTKKPSAENSDNK